MSQFLGDALMMEKDGCFWSDCVLTDSPRMPTDGAPLFTPPPYFDGGLGDGGDTRRKPDDFPYSPRFCFQGLLRVFSLFVDFLSGRACPPRVWCVRSRRSRDTRIVYVFHTSRSSIGFDLEFVPVVSVGSFIILSNSLRSRGLYTPLRHPTFRVVLRVEPRTRTIALLHREERIGARVANPFLRRPRWV